MGEPTGREGVKPASRGSLMSYLTAWDSTWAGSGWPEVAGPSAGASNHASLLNPFCLEVLSCLIDWVNARLDLRF